MKKIINKKLILVIMFIVVITTNSFAFNFGNVINNGDSFRTSAEAAAVDSTEVTALIKELSGALLSIGAVVAIIAGLVIAIKIMTDGATGKAELKASLFPYAIGIIVLVGGFGIWQAVVKVLQSF